MVAYGAKYGAIAGAISGAILGLFAFVIGALFGLVIGAIEGIQIGIVVGIFAGLATNLIYPKNNNMGLYRIVMILGCAILSTILAFIKSKQYFNTANGGYTLIIILSLLGGLCAIPISNKLVNIYFKTILNINS